MKRIFTAVLILGGLACKDGDKKKDESEKPPPQSEADAKKYEKAGAKGKFKVTRHEDGKETELDPEKLFESDTSLEGSSMNEMAPDRPIEKCEVTYYFSATESEPSVRNCADGKGWKSVCEAARARAFERAARARRLCEKLPSCNAKVNENGQAWSCEFSQTANPKFVPGGTEPELVDPRWDKDCRAQYETVCFTQ